MGIFKIKIMKKIKKVFTISNVILSIIFVWANCIVAVGSFVKLGMDSYFQNLYAIVAILVTILIDRFVINQIIINFKEMCYEEGN